LGKVFYTCDMCGEQMQGGRDLHYVAKIQVYAGADPLEFTAEELKANIREKIRRLLEQMEDMDARELEESVYREFRFDLCPRCWRRYVEDPLPRWSPTSRPGREGP